MTDQLVISANEFEVTRTRVALPRAETHLVVRFGQSTDVFALGARPRAHRKQIAGGQRAVSASIPLAMHEALLGVSAKELSGRVVPLEDLWGASAAQRLLSELSNQPDSSSAMRVLHATLTARTRHVAAPSSRLSLALEAARRLPVASVSSVADQLCVSERHLRRVFHEAVGVSPRTFSKVARFHRALRAAQRGSSWVTVALDAGYYDQAHLIAEFRDLTGATPTAFLRELGSPLQRGMFA